MTTSSFSQPSLAKPRADDVALLERVQRDSFHFFNVHASRQNGLVPDSSQKESACSIAAVGFALSAYPVAIQHGWMSRVEALDLALAALRFFDIQEDGDTPHDIGHKGFFYHFLDMVSGKRAYGSELSVIDTALLLAGVLCVARYFDGADAAEAEIRQRAEAIYGRIDWPWMQNGGKRWHCLEP